MRNIFDGELGDSFNEIFGVVEQPKKPTITGDELLAQINEVSETLKKFDEKRDIDAQKIFKDLFRADYKRGDLVIFSVNRKATYDLFMEKLPDHLRSRLRLDHTESLKEPVVLNGQYIPKPMEFNDKLFGGDLCT